MTTDDVIYNVECMNCGSIWQPMVRTPLWWRAYKQAQSGKLNAVVVTGQECGCKPVRFKPETPYRVFGYGAMCDEYDLPCKTFVEAVSKYLLCLQEGDIVFIEGVSQTLQDKLTSMW